MPQLDLGKIIPDIDKEPIKDSKNAVSSGGVYNALQQISNKNLLDNWYFVDPINQRGFSTLKSGMTVTPFLDRWSTRRTALELKDNGLSFAWDGVNGETGYIRQYIECAKMAGKTLIISALIDGELYTDSITVPSKIDTEQYGSVQNGIRFSIGYVSNEIIFLIVYSMSTVPKIIQAVKLEIGTEQTLAHKENDTWVLNDSPPNKALELAKCQRYYIPFETDYPGWRTAFCVSGYGTVLYVPRTMRVVPTPISNPGGAPQIYLNQTWHDIGIESIRKYPTQCVIFFSNLPSGLEVGKSYLVRNMPSLSADLYM